MAPGTAAPIRDPSRNNFKSPLKKAARRIVTAPTFNVIRTIDFDKKSEYEKFIQFIDSSNKELAKIKLEKPEIDSKLASILPLYLPDLTTMSIQGKSLQLSWFKRILENWKKFTKWFKKTKLGKRLRNLLAGWKNLKRKIKNLIKWIKSIKWKNILTNIKNSKVGKFIKEIVKWFKKPPKFPKWSTDIVKKAKDILSRVRGMDFAKLGKDLTQNFKKFQTKYLNKKTFQDLSKLKGLTSPTALAWTAVLNLGGSSYRPELQDDIQGERARKRLSWGHLLGGVGWDSENYKTIKLEGGNFNKLYAKFEKEKFNKNEEIIKLRKELHAIKPWNVDARMVAEENLAAAKDKYREQLQKEFIEQNPILQERIKNQYKKDSDLYKFVTEELDLSQSNIKSNNTFDLSKIYSMDSKMFDSGYALLNNAPRLYVMESEGEPKYVPFSLGASSNNSLSLYDEIDYSQLNSKILDEMRFIKLSGG